MTATIAVWFIFFQNTDIVEDTNTPEYTIKNFENFFNNYDMDGILECIHPTYRKTFDVAREWIEMLLKPKWDISFIMNLAKMGIPLLPYVPDLNISSDDLPSLSLNVTDSEVDGDTAECIVSGTLTAGTFSKDFEYVVVLEKIDDMWYIVKTK